MNYSKKTVKDIVEKVKMMLKNDPIASDIVQNNPPKIHSIINEQGRVEIQSIRFDDYRERYVEVTAGGIYISPKDYHMFSTDSWDEFMSIDESNIMVPNMLESGMIVTTACGKHYMVMRNTRINDSKHASSYMKNFGILVEIGGDDIIRLASYREDMKSSYCDPEHQNENIIRVSMPVNFGYNKTFEELGEDVIWQRYE